MVLKNVADGNGKRCPWFSHRLPVILENDGQSLDIKKRNTFLMRSAHLSIKTNYVDWQ